MAEVLIAEDEKNLREGFAVLLESAGYAVRTAKNGAEALAAYEEKRPDLLLLDVMMPKLNGYEVCMNLRRRDPALPIIFLTAKTSEADKVLGLGLGADDYITKPTASKQRELVARVAAALRRVEALSARAEETTANVVPGKSEESGGVNFDVAFDFGSSRIDARRLDLMDSTGEHHALTPRELNILRLLAMHPNEALNREYFFGSIWGVGYGGTTRTLDQFVLMLRKKLGADAERLETVHGCGYRYRP